MQGVGIADGYVARLVEIVELPLQFRYGWVYHLDRCMYVFRYIKVLQNFCTYQCRYFTRLT